MFWSETPGCAASLLNASPSSIRPPTCEPDSSLFVMRGAYRPRHGGTSEGLPNFVTFPKWVVLPNEAMLVRPGGRCGASGDIQLDEDVAHMAINGLLAQEEFVRDGLVGLACRDMPQHLLLPHAQAVGVRYGAGVSCRGRGWTHRLERGNVWSGAEMDEGFPRGLELERGPV